MLTYKGGRLVSERSAAWLEKQRMLDGVKRVRRHQAYLCLQAKLRQIQLPRLQRCAKGCQLLMELGAVR